MATIPMDVIRSCIFPRLPVKSLTRFKSVSKFRQKLIPSPEFIRFHHHHALSSDASRLFVFVKDSIFHIHEPGSPLAPELAPIFANIILASSEFFLLISLYGNPAGLALLNLSTGWYYTIPYPPYYHNGEERFGTCLDVANHDYKVVRITQPHYSLPSYITEIETQVMVCSLRNHKWRLIETRLDDKCYRICRNDDTSAVIRHLLHILFVNTNAKKRIGCFDILAEKWTNDVPLPPHLNNDLESINLLTVLDGLLCVTGVDKEENWSVWVMKEYGVQDSWFKLMSIASKDIVYSEFYPIASRITGSRHEVLCKRVWDCNTEFIWYNIREKKATTATIEGIHGYICKQSLVEFPGGGHVKLHQPN